VKAFVAVSKTELGNNPGLGTSLSAICSSVEDSDDVFKFHPKEGELMNLICILLDKEVVYRLNLNSAPVEEN